MIFCDKKTTDLTYADRYKLGQSLIYVDPTYFSYKVQPCMRNGDWLNILVERVKYGDMREQKQISNIAFIDGQNLHMGTKSLGWSVDYKKFRVYLRDKYHITEAYYFLGYVSEEEQDLYTSLQKAGFILSFREHSSALKGKKKGNVDSDIVFNAMKKLVDKEPFDKIFLVSGDGDYIKLVDFLVKKERFGKMLFPNKEFASSLYKKLGGEHFDYLENPHVKDKISYHK